MREDRFFVNQELKLGTVEIFDPGVISQIRNVLRKKKGDKIILFNNSQSEARAQINELLKNKMKVEIFEVSAPGREPKISLALFCSTLKKDNFELVVQKATEIGVKEIVPVLCHNSVKTRLNFQRLEKIIKEAAEQSKRVTLPRLLEVMSFSEAIAKSKDFDLKILFDVRGESFSLPPAAVEKVALFIGPEGGFTVRELELAQKNDFKIFNLGKLTLRAETAAIVSSFLALYELA
jgi:16S rRNA (uracil1498-N3)-methyltransferase